MTHIVRPEYHEQVCRALKQLHSDLPESLTNRELLVIVLNVLRMYFGSGDEPNKRIEEFLRAAHTATAAVNALVENAAE